MLNGGLTDEFLKTRKPRQRIKVFLNREGQNAGPGAFRLDEALEVHMDTKGVPLYAALRAKMEWLSERQKLLAENIANADTPGYRARDLKPLDFGQLLKRRGSSDIAMTHARHLKGASDAQRFTFKPEDAGSDETNPSGNAVTIEDQMVKLGEIQMEYETVAGVYRKQAQLLKLALGRQN